MVVREYIGHEKIATQMKRKPKDYTGNRYLLSDNANHARAFPSQTPDINISLAAGRRWCDRQRKLEYGTELIDTAIRGDNQHNRTEMTD